LSPQQSLDITTQIRSSFDSSGEAALVTMAAGEISVSDIGSTSLSFTKAPTPSAPTVPDTEAPTLPTPAPTLPPTNPGDTYAPTVPPTPPPTDSPTRPPTTPPPPPVNIVQTTAEEQCTVSDFTKIMMAVASTICGLVAFMSITFWFILERGRGGSGYSSLKGPDTKFAAVGQPVGHSLFKSRKVRATLEEQRGLVNRRGAGEV